MKKLICCLLMLNFSCFSIKESKDLSKKEAQAALYVLDHFYAYPRAYSFGTNHLSSLDKPKAPPYQETCQAVLSKIYNISKESISFEWVIAKNKELVDLGYSIDSGKLGFFEVIISFGFSDYIDKKSIEALLAENY